MTKQTKLVKCGTTIFLYDFQGKGIKVKELGFERDAIKGRITEMKRMLLTNFSNDSLLATFHLKISLSEYNQVPDKLNLFTRHLKESSGYHDIKYLAVTELSPEKTKKHAYIHLITSVEIHELTAFLNDDISEEEEEQYFEDIWRDELSIDVYSLKQLLDTFTSAYEGALKSNILREYPKSFYNNIEQPLILWNEDAETFIKDHHLLEYPTYQSQEIYDEQLGFVMINEYSLEQLDSHSNDLNMFGF
ncbi:hypothetical protein [Metabacillus fastidiosus]|uniref:hypothetical protein n=1 Tax=Metabacillus fastidiosus TaxID=1458 RepID=UPI002E24F2D1|nr:hypothetical protein [Metabacillus fastidiosus]